MSYRTPYKGLKILDISQGFAGPYCAGIFALYGADVTKIEPPEGDWIRYIGSRFGDHTALSMLQLAVLDKQVHTLSVRVLTP